MLLHVSTIALFIRMSIGGIEDVKREVLEIAVVW